MSLYRGGADYILPARSYIKAGIGKTELLICSAFHSTVANFTTVDTAERNGLWKSTSIVANFVQFCFSYAVCESR